jgi:hypothetical protein
MQGTGNREQGIGKTMHILRQLGVISAMAATLALAGCRQDMQDQPKFYPQRGTTLFADGRSVRPQVENTVGRDQLHEDSYFYTGLQDGKEGDGLPIPLTAATMQRGQERFNIYCTPCHSRVGNGDGMIVQRGYRPAGNFHTDRLRSAPLGHFFAVMTNGYGAMPDYSAQLSPGGPLGGCRIHSRPAAQPEREIQRPARRRAPEGPARHRARSGHASRIRGSLGLSGHCGLRHTQRRRQRHSRAAQRCTQAIVKTNL